MKRILESELREQAGSESYNRFEYQAHWIVYHMIDEYKNNKDFLIFCEFHDDMAKTDEQNSCTEFFQIKTTIKYSSWTLSRLFNRTKGKSGNYKHSFLGFIFYNFLNFQSECSKCHFVSNIGMDKEITTWQSIIEDNKELKIENNALYEKIKDFLRIEYKSIDKKVFDDTFEVFIQNTFLFHGDLPLDNYEKVIAGDFFKMLDNKDIYTSNSNKILREVIDEVRKKSKFKIKTPISYKRLVNEKGVSSQVFEKLKNIMNKDDSLKNTYDEIEASLQNHQFPNHQIKLIIRHLKDHHRKLLDINDQLYRDTFEKLQKIIDEVLVKNYKSIDNIVFLAEQVHLLFDTAHPNFNEVVVEAIFYEKIFS